MTPSWYDVLDVDEDATPEEIRAAWRTAIADLDPGERRFRLANQAAEVLLDPDRRAAHDAALAAEAGQVDDADDADEVDEVDEVDAAPAATVAAPADEGVDDADADADDPSDADAADAAADADAADVVPHGRSRRWPYGPGLLAAAAVALVLLVLTVVALVQGLGDDDGTPLPDDRAIEAARGAAEAAVVPVLAYDYRTLADDQAEARTYLTEDYATEYDRFFSAAVETNAPRTKTIVRVQVVDSAIVRTGEDRVDVLLFVNRPTTNAERSVEYRDQVTMRMLDVDGTWLVDCMVTTGTGPCD